MSQPKDLTGQRFGRLVAIRLADEPYITPSGAKYLQWLCQCDCGTQLLVPRRKLTSGEIMDCGCHKQEALDKLKAEMIGRRFGRLTVLSLSDDMYVSPSGKKRDRLWVCRCDCGNEVTVTAGGLKSGTTRSCGCLQREAASNNKKDLTGKRFGRLTVLKRVPLKQPDKNGTKNGWLCRCDCGTEKVVSAAHLLKGATISCGCLSREKQSIRLDPEKENVIGRYEGTTISLISPERKINSNNTSGVRGVSWVERDHVWAARINIQGRRINLGRYVNKEDAIAARKAAEEEYFAPIIEEYNAKKGKKK